MENNNLEIKLYADYAKKQPSNKFIIFAIDVILDIIRSAIININMYLIIRKPKNGYAENVLIELRY